MNKKYTHYHKGKISQVPMEKIASIPEHTCDFKIPAPPYLRFLHAIFSSVLAIFVILAIFRVKPYLRFYSQVCFTKSQVWRAKGTVLLPLATTSQYGRQLYVLSKTPHGSG